MGLGVLSTRGAVASFVLFPVAAWPHMRLVGSMPGVALKTLNRATVHWPVVVEPRGSRERKTGGGSVANEWTMK